MLIHILIIINLLAGTPHTAAEMVLMLLEATPVPLISPFEDAVLTVNRNEDWKDVVKFMLPYRKKVFIYVCFFLREVLKNSASNRLTASKLGENS